MERDVRARPGLHGLSLSMVITGLLCAAVLLMPSLAGADALPDGRAYELVTPGISGVSISSTSTEETQVGPSGDALAFVAKDAPASAPSSGIYNPFVSTRGTGGWDPVSEAVPFTQPESGFLSTQLLAFSSDLSESLVVTDQPLVPGAPAGENLYLRTAGGSYSLLTDAAVDSTSGGGTLPRPDIAGVSPDLSHVFFNPVIAQLPTDPVNYAQGNQNLYQWAHGQLSIVNVMPNGTLSPDASAIPSDTVAGLSSISSDGDEVLFQDTDNNGNLGQLYLRVNGTSTDDVSAPAPGVTNPGSAINDPPSAVGVTADGSQVLFTSGQALTANAFTGAGHFGNDLYDYDVSTGTLTDLTADNSSADASNGGADVQAVVGVDPAASYVYFIATGDLAAGATTGDDNLYVEHDQKIAYVSSGAGILTNGSPAAYVTPSGADLAFESTDSLTGYDNTDQVTGQPDTEIYEYDAPTGSLVCASCRPDGVAPTAGATIPVGDGANIGSTPVAVSDNGSQVFFESSDQIIAGASNGLENVYEYENGAVSLISPGDGASGATLIGGDGSGDDVYFVDYDDLVPPENASQQSAIWDARVGGGFPVAGGPSGACTATTQCRGSSTAPPTVPVVATVTFSTTTGSVRVQRHIVHGASVSLRVRVGGAGRLTASARGLRAVHRTLRHRGTVTLTLHLTASARAQLAHRSLHLTIHIRFASSSGTRRATVKVTAQKRGHR